MGCWAVVLGFWADGLFWMLGFRVGLLACGLLGYWAVGMKMLLSCSNDKRIYYTEEILLFNKTT